MCQTYPSDSVATSLKTAAVRVCIAILKLHPDPVGPQPQQIGLGGGTKSRIAELPKMGDDLIYGDEKLLLAIHDEKSSDSIPKFSVGVIEFIEHPVDGFGEFIGSLVEWVARVSIDEDLAFLTLRCFFSRDVFDF